MSPTGHESASPESMSEENENRFKELEVNKLCHSLGIYGLHQNYKTPLKSTLISDAVLKWIGKMVPVLSAFSFDQFHLQHTALFDHH